MSSNQPWSEQAINKVAEIAIATQIKTTESLKVNIKTDLNKLAKGQLDSIAIRLNGFLMDHELKADEFYLQIGQVTVKPLSAMRGNIRLVHPSEGSLSLTIHQDCFTAALAAALLKPKGSSETSKLRSQSSEQALGTDMIEAIRCLFADGAVTFAAEVPREGTSQSISFTAAPQITPTGRGVSWENVGYLEGEEPWPQFTQQVLAKVDELLSLQGFERQGTSFTVQQIALADGLLTIQARADIQQFPSAS